MKCGIVDVGSNTIRLSIYHWEGETFKRLMNKKEMAGLAGYIKTACSPTAASWWPAAFCPGSRRC